VLVAIGLAFAAHVDAVDLFNTYLRDPNARAKVIEQTQAVTAQYKAAKEAADTLKQIAATANAADPGKQQPAPVSDVADTGKPPAPGTKPPSENAASTDVKGQVDQLRKDWEAAIGDVNATVAQYADLGVPLGWTAERIDAADTSLWFWTCKDPKTGKGLGLGTFRERCAGDNNDKAYKGAKGRQFVDVWLQVPRNVSVWFYLILGGLLIGLGSPFWFDVVTNLTSLRGAARGQAPVAAAPPQPAAPAAPDASKAQPVTPVGAFQVSSAARVP
jgi:hypothetical protein